MMISNFIVWDEYSYLYIVVTSTNTKENIKHKTSYGTGFKLSQQSQYELKQVMELNISHHLLPILRMMLLRMMLLFIA